MIDKHESITAKICSFVRAYHSIYSHEKIFDDSLAYDLLRQHEYLKVGQLIEHNFDAMIREAGIKVPEKEPSPKTQEDILS